MLEVGAKVGRTVLGNMEVGDTVGPNVLGGMEEGTLVLGTGVGATVASPLPSLLALHIPPPHTLAVTATAERQRTTPKQNFLKEVVGGREGGGGGGGRGGEGL